MDLTETTPKDLLEILKETEKAWQVKLKEGVYWLPKSQCRIIGKKIYIPKWLAESKEMEV